VTVAGGIDGVRWQSKADTVIDDGQIDFYYNASTDGKVTIQGLPANKDVAAISDDTTVPEIQGRTTTDASGTATFDLNSGKHDIRIRETPGNLTIKNESDPSEIITGTQSNPVEVEIRFFLSDDTDSPDEIISRSTTDGKVNMTGLPKNESFVVVADADGFEPRRVFVESLLQQETIYLLPESKPSVTKLYQLKDFTGLYPQEDSVLKIQRGINNSWQTVQGDFFGATGEFEAVLAENTRHRLVILNTETGDRRVLGRVTPINTGTSEVEIQSREDIELSRLGPIASIGPRVGALPAAKTDVSVGVRPAGATVASWNYTVTLQPDSGPAQTLASGQLSDAGSENPSFNITNETGTVLVEVGWESADGRTMVETKRYRIVEQYEGYSLLDGLTNFSMLFSNSGDAEAATSVIALLTSVFGAGAVAIKMRASTEGIGLSALGMLAIWSVVGWISYAVVFAGAVVWTALVALRRGI